MFFIRRMLCMNRPTDFYFFVVRQGICMKHCCVALFYFLFIIQQSTILSQYKFDLQLNFDIEVAFYSIDEVFRSKACPQLASGFGIDPSAGGLINNKAFKCATQGTMP